jgi:predicted RNA binding protein YcfA (HicA-like mRNA interferase family)
VPQRTYSGKEIIKALDKWGFKRVDQEGSHVKLKYKNPDTGEIRTVNVPLHDELATGTLQSIAEQAGAKEFQKFLTAIDDLI